VAAQRQRQFVGGDTGTIVLDHHRACATGQQPHGDLGGAGVERVVHQFAHHRGRAFDDLAGGDPADQLIWQVADRPASRRCVAQWQSCLNCRRLGYCR
jgi:hypothetical protein